MDDKNCASRVFVVGGMGAGKTTFLAGLAHLLGVTTDSQFDRMAAKDPATRRELDELQTVFGRGEWPSPTSGRKRLRLNMSFLGETVELHVNDDPGESITGVCYESPEADGAQEFWRDLRRANVVLLMLDPQFDLALPERLTEEELETARERKDRLNEIIMKWAEGLLDDHEEGRAGTTPQDRSLAIVITKSDGERALATA